MRLDNAMEKILLNYEIKFDYLNHSNDCDSLLIAVPFIVKGCLHEVRDKGSFALHVCRSSANKFISSVDEDLGSILGDLKLAHLTATVHPGSHVYCISPNVILRLLSTYDTRYYWTVI